MSHSALLPKRIAGSVVRFFGAVAVLATVCGCSSLDRTLYQGYSAAPLEKEAVDKYRELATALNSAPKGGTALVPSECFGAPADADGSCRAARDQAVAALVIGSDQLCLDHRRSIYGRDAAWNVATGTLTNLFAGMAAVVTSESRKSILSALALFSNSERSLVNEAVYKQMIVTSVDKKIVEIRDAKQSAIYAELKKPIAQYPLHTALRDVVDYHVSCSFMTGLQRALDEGTQGTNAQKVLRLRANFAAVASQVPKATPGSQEETLLKERLTAISEALKALENQ